MKTRSIAVALSLVLMLGMVACGGQQAQQEPDQGQVQQSEPNSTTPPVESMEAKNETDTAIPLAELEVVTPEETDGANTVEGAESVEVELFTEVNGQSMRQAQSISGRVIRQTVTSWGV